MSEPPRRGGVFDWEALDNKAGDELDFNHTFHCDIQYLVRISEGIDTRTRRLQAIYVLVYTQFSNLYLVIW